MKGEPVLWRCACSLLSILSLLAALHLSIPDFNLEILMQRYKWYFIKLVHFVYTLLCILTIFLFFSFQHCIFLFIKIYSA